MEQSSSGSPPAAHAPLDRAGGLIAGLVLGAVFLALAMPLMFRSPRIEFDETEFHLPAILEFAREWPHFDFRSYTSATTPGYHLVLAAAARYVSDDVRVLRVIGSLFTVGALVTAGVVVGRRTGAVAGIVLCLPLLASPYLFRPGVWLLPQNAGWWGVVAVLAVAFRPKVDWVTYCIGALALAALVFVRQLHLWAASVLWLAAWLGTDRGSDQGIFDDTGARLRRAVVMGLFTLPAFLIVGYFFKLWGGMVPSIYQREGELRTGAVYMDGGNPAVPACILSLTAVIGLFFLPVVWPRVLGTLRADRRLKAAVVAAAAAGFVIGVVPHTSYDAAAGRWSGIWNAVKHLRTFADRSPLIIVLSTLGAAVAALWWAALGRRDRWLFLATFAVFTLAQSFSSMAWQRYYEPFLLMIFPLAAARMAATERADVRAQPGGVDAVRPSAAALAGPLLLAAGLALVTVLTLWNIGGFGTFPPTTQASTAPAVATTTTATATAPPPPGGPASPTQ